MSRRLILLLAVAVALFTLAPAAGAGSGNENFTASLKARNETGDVESDATGQAIVKLRSGELTFKLIVANIDNVVAAHIHCGAVGVAGPVGVTLFSGGPSSDSGILAQGEITAPDPGNGCGWADLQDVIDALQSGDTYVNVHTPAFPAGEIRGQLS